MCVCERGERRGEGGLNLDLKKKIASNKQAP